MVARIVAVALVALVALVAVCQASAGYGYQPASYGQNYERKTGFKSVIYHPYGGVSNRFDYRTFPAYGNSYGAHPAPYIKTGLEYSIQDQGYGQSHY